MTFAHRCVKGFSESQRKAVEQVIQSHCFSPFTHLAQPGELEIGIAYDSDFTARCVALETDLQAKVNQNIRVV
jgi:hypothetical protein